MLGEAALTEDDAARYMQSYVDAIHAIGKARPGAASMKGRASPSSSAPCTRATAAHSTPA
jgi:proline dehydrogenase